MILLEVIILIFHKSGGNMKKFKWLYIIGSVLVVIAAAAYFLPRLILYMTYSPTLGEKEVQLIENLPKATDSLNMKNGKYVLAFSELKSLKDANTGAFYVIDESGKFLSQSTKQNLAEPISMTSTNNQAYVVNNRSAQRSSIDLKTGKIESINFNKNLSHSFSIQSNNDYVIYDVAGELKDGQKLVYWHRNKPSNKKSLTIPHGFTHSIHIERDDAYITTADPDAIAYIHHVDLKDGHVVSSKKLDLDDEEYSKSGLPGNPALTYYKGYLYYAVNQVKAESDDSTVINAGKLVKIDPKTLAIVKKIPIGDENFNPDSLAVVKDQMIILSGYSEAYVMNEQEQMKKQVFKLPENQLPLLNEKNTLTEQITIKGNKAYIFTMYDLRKAKEDDNVRGEINEINLENGEQISRTIINMPVSTYLTMTFAVIQS